MLDRAQIGPDDTVVAVGTGTGLLAVGALDRLGPDGSVVVVDVSVDCLERLRRDCEDPRVSYLVGSADVLPLPDASVDVALTHSGIVDVCDEAEAARELFRVLRPGGRISLFEPAGFDAGDLERVFADAGFSDLDPEVVVTSVGLLLAGTKP